MRTILIGNPENRRIIAFQNALISAGKRPAEVVSYRALLEDVAALADVDAADAIVRQDSAGENFDVEKALLVRGYEAACELGVRTISPERARALPFDRGRIVCPRQHHLGFLSLLGSLEAVFAERPNWRVLQPTAGIAFLFDKRKTQRRWASIGIAVPPIIDNVETADELRQLASTDHGEFFVKVSCASSASCLAIYQKRRDAELLTTTIECAATGWYNSLRLSRYRDPERIVEVLNFLLSEGAQVERAVPKARVSGQLFDIRYVVIDGDAPFALVRQNRHPITNLHLGGWRGEMTALENAIGREVLDAARADATAAARDSGCFVVGVDVLIEANRRGHRVIEGNAFGDLLPGLTREGRSVYEWQIDRMAADNPDPAGSIAR